MDDKKQEDMYGKPDTTLSTFSTDTHEHFFIRKNATDLGCTKCTNGWIDGGEFLAEEGKLIANPSHKAII